MTPSLKSSGHEKIVQLLIKNGADVNLKNDEGLTPIHAAAEFGMQICIEVE